MSKLQKFNHYVFAIFGTLALVSITYFMGNKIYDDFIQSHYSQPTAQLTDEEVRKLVQENKFIQTISYEFSFWATPKIIKKENTPIKIIQSPYYVIPVSFTTLKKETITNLKGEPFTTLKLKKIKI